MKFYNILTAKHRKSVISSLFALPFLLSMSGGAMATLDPSEEDYALKLLGKYLFFDKISSPRRQACASCHAPEAGWTNGVSRVNATQVAVNGAMRHTVGTLKPPTSSYATLVPDFTNGPPFGPNGGNFWNGRAKGDEVRNLNILGGDLDKYAKYFGGATDQAHASPFINPVEQGLPNITAVCRIVKKAKYAPLYKIAYGERIRCGMDHVEVTFGRIALAIGAYEASGDVNMFDSKRDRAIRDELDKYGVATFPLDKFTDQENLGHDLFYGAQSELNPTGKSAGCGVFCHRSNAATDPLGVSEDERYTGDGYFNIGTPRNFEIPNSPEPDIGVAATTGVDAQKGAHKAPTLRNVDKRKRKKFIKAYTHNGWFKSLESLVHFYNSSTIGGATATSFGITRCPDGVVTEKDALAQNCWPEPEFDAGTGAPVIRAFIGDRNLSLEEEAAIVAYMKALSDIPTAKKPKPFNLKRFYKGKPF